MTAANKSQETTAVTESEGPAFASKLERGAQRFLAHVLVHSHEFGRRTAADFMRHFPPADIMGGLKSTPHLRADILEVATGLKRKVALKKSAASAGEDVQIALEEEVCTAEDIVAAFQPDDRIRYLDNKKIWAYLIEGECWKGDRKNKKEHDIAKKHLAFVLERALEDRLISHQDLIDGVSVETLAESLPRELLGEIVSFALTLGKEKKVFSEAHLLEIAAAQKLVENVKLEHLWERVVVPKIAAAHGLVDSPSPEEAQEEKASAAPAENGAAGAKEGAKKEAAAETRSKPASNGRSAEAKGKDGPGKEKAAPPEPGVEVVEIMEIEEDEFDEHTDPGVRGAP